MFKKISIIVVLQILISCKNNDKTNSERLVSKIKSDTIENKIIENEDFEKNIVTEKNEPLETYCNERFGFCLQYPKNLLFSQGESANGDGTIFKSKDAETTLTIYRDYRDNMTEEFYLSDAFEEDTYSSKTVNKDKVITYKKIFKNHYIVSGLKNGKIFYQKTIYKNELLSTAIIEYNENQANIYNKYSELLSKTFN